MNSGFTNCFKFSVRKTPLVIKTKSGLKFILMAWIFVISIMVNADNLPKKHSGKASVVRKSNQNASAKTKSPLKHKNEKEASSDKLKWTREISKWTRTVRVADDNGSTGYSSAMALAFDGQYLVVPWAFVSEALLARSGSRFFTDEPRQEIFLSGIDLVANLAVFKSGKPLLPSLSRSQLRLDAPKTDEQLLVLVSRDWIRPGVRFLQAKADGASVRYHIAFPGGDIGATRYVFDRSGNFVAIASGRAIGEIIPVGENERIWSGSASALAELLREQERPHPASIQTLEQRRRQLFYWQERWAKALVPSPSAIVLRSLDCHAYLASIADQVVASYVRGVRAFDCEGRFPLQLGGGYTTGLRVWTGEAALEVNSQPESVGTKVLTNESIADRLVQAFSAEAFADLNRSATLVNLLTVPECRQSSVKNRFGQSVQIRFCTSAIKIESGLSDTVISVSSIENNKKAHFAVARLKGFDQQNTKNILESLIENVWRMK